MSRIQELATTIAANTEKIDHFLTTEKMPTPSFDIDGPQTLDLPSDLQKSRDLVIDATTELKELLQGPKELLMSNPVSYPLLKSEFWVPVLTDASTLQSSQPLSLRAIYQYRIAESFPVGSEATFQQISEACGLNEPDVRRILRHAMSHRIFRETCKGVVVHTGASQLLAQNQQLRSWIGVSVEEMWPSAVNVLQMKTFEKKKGYNYWL